MDVKTMTHVGFLSRLHGVQGGIILRSEEFPLEEIEAGEYLFVEIEGRLVPFLTRSIKSRDQESSLVFFEDVEPGDSVSELVGKVVYTDKEISITGEDDDDLKGYSLFDEHDIEIGKVEQVMDYSGNVVLQIMQGTREILVPFADEFILEVNDKEKLIRAKLPEGLIDIND
jgi:16S rRNA processing protein RimM